MATDKMMFIKILIAILIFTILLSVKSVVFANIDSYGLTPFQQNEILEIWSAFKGDYLFILVSIAISLVIGLKFSFKF